MATYAETVTVEQLDDDPYPIYARLRREEPVVWVPSVGLWLVTRAADVELVATKPELFCAALTDSPLDRSFGGPTILTMDGEPHLDVRRSLDTKYRPRVVESYIDDLVRPIATRLAEGLAVAPDRRAELMADYFEPVSVLGLAAVLGLAHLDADTLRSWFHGLAMGATNFERDPVKQQANDATAAEIDRALAPLAARLLMSPDDSTISHMLHTGRDPGCPRDFASVLPSLKVIILGGMQEPGHGAGSTLYALLADREQLDAVVADRALVDAAVHEGLRWVAPIGTQTRQAVLDVELGGVTIPAGGAVGAVVASACRDESVFDDPDRFDVFRPRRPNAAFGFGSHFCAGHAFARGLERVAIDVLLDALPGIALAGDVAFRGWEFRAPATLPVTWPARAGAL